MQRFFASIVISVSFLTTTSGEATFAQGSSVSRAGDFVDSIGVDTHFNYPGTPYTDQNAAIVDALIKSGIKHIRDGGFHYSRQRTLTYLAQHGVTHSLGFAAGTSGAQIESTLRANAPYVDYVEPQNELDLKKDRPDWASEWRNEQQLLYTTVRADPANANIVVVGPALGHFRDAPQLGPIDQFEDVGSMHHYPCSFNPGEMHVPMSLDAVMAKVRLVHVTKPLWTTEIGYEDDLPGGKCALPDSVIAKYNARTLTERWLAGQKRTYFYQFADMYKLTSYDAMGFVTVNGTPKPQYLAMQSLLQLLADPSRNFSSTLLSYSLGGETNNVHQLLLQKSDGTYFILLWLEVSGWNAATQSVINVPVQNVKIRLAAAPHSAIDYQYTSNWTYRPQQLPLSSSITVPIGDSISVIEIRP